MILQGGCSLTDLLAIAEEAAMSVAPILLDAPTSERTARQPDAAELVTELDLAAEASIRGTILSQRPADGFLGEELGGVPGQTDVEWIVDPVDGTVNYVAGLPQWAISVAARIAGRPVVAVVHAPELACTYTALAGSGAWRNGARISSRRLRVPSLRSAVITTGFASDTERRADQIDQLGRVLGVVRDIRCYGAASLELCSVAVGEIDAYYESGLRPWDVAAGALIATEAGIEVSGGPWSGEATLVAAPPPLAGPLRQLVANLASVAFES